MKGTRSMLHNHLVGWPEIDNESPTTQAIQKLLRELDDIIVEYECRWGIGRFEGLTPSDLLSKWEKQTQKLHDAICANDMDLVQDLVRGCIRGLSAIEAAILASGHQPYEADCWQYEHNGRTFCLVKSGRDGRAYHKPQGRPVTIVTMEEIARIITALDEGVVMAGREEADKVLKQKGGVFDFSQGDDIPWE